MLPEYFSVSSRIILGIFQDCSSMPPAKLRDASREVLGCFQIFLELLCDDFMIEVLGYFQNGYSMLPE